MRRKTTSLGYVRSNPRFAVMFDGETFTLERLVGGTRKRISEAFYRTDEEARGSVGQDVEWRRLNVAEGFVRSFSQAQESSSSG